MKKYYIYVDKQHLLNIEELDVEIVQAWEPGGKCHWEYQEPHEHNYKVLSPGKFQGEIWCWHALCDERELATKIGIIQIRNLQAKLINFLQFFSLVVNDKLDEKHKWRI